MEVSKASEITDIRSLNRFDQEKDKLEKPMWVLKNIIEELENNKNKIFAIKQALRKEKNNIIIKEINSDLKKVETYTKALDDLKWDITHNINNKPKEVNIDISDIDESFLKYAYKINLEWNIKYLSMKPTIIDWIKVSWYINVDNQNFTIVDWKILSLVLSKDDEIISTFENKWLKLNKKDPTIIEAIKLDKSIKDKKHSDKNTENTNSLNNPKQIQDFEIVASEIEILWDELERKSEDINGVHNEIDELLEDLKDDPDYAELVDYNDTEENSSELTLNEEWEIDLDELSKQMNQVMQEMREITSGIIQKKQEN